MKKLIFGLVVLSSLLMQSCTENYANGERIGLITQFSRSGVIWKSWEGHLNLTQTGMNSSSSTPFDFSIDNDNEPDQLVKTIDSAAQYGWKVKMVYHETKGRNWFGNRGETDHFVTHCEVLDKTPVQSAFGGSKSATAAPSTGGHVIDTIYVVIFKDK